MALNLFRKLFSSTDERAAVAPLYAAIIAEARQPHWYLDGKVADWMEKVSDDQYGGKAT